MSEQPSKKRVIVYVIIFVLFAFLIVFFSQKNTNKQASEMVGTDGDMAESVEFVDVSSEVDDGVMHEESVPLEEKARPIVTVKNTDTGTSAIITATEENDTLDKKLIKTGSIDMRVNSVEDSIDKIREIALSHGGDEVSSDIEKNDFYKRGVIVVKVPVNQYNEVFARIKDIAPLVVDESSQSRDVTAQFMDLETRIKNKKDHEVRLRSFFSKAEDVDELIQVEKELARVRTEIEQMEGQLKYLKDQTQYSTIHVMLLEDANIVVSDSWRPLQVVKDSFNTLLRKMTNLINVMIRFVITSLPFIIIFIVVAWLGHLVIKHFFGKDKDENDGQNEDEEVRKNND